MKVLTCKILALTIALAPANSAFAGGWLSHYMPSWIAKPISMAYDLISPHLPATKADAIKIQSALKKEHSAAELLLKATQEDLQDISAKTKANSEDLEFLENRSRKFQEDQEVKFLEHYKDLYVLNTSQNTNYSILKENALEVATLKSQFAHALAGIKIAHITLDGFKKNLSEEIAELQKNTTQSHQELKSTFDLHHTERDQEYQHIEQQLLAMNQQIKTLQKTVNEQSEKINSDTKEKNGLIAQLEAAAIALEKQNARILARKERRKKKKNGYTAPRTQKVITVEKVSI
jgi:chromosome segregation ATPase